VCNVIIIIITITTTVTAAETWVQCLLCTFRPASNTACPEIVFHGTWKVCHHLPSNPLLNRTLSQFNSVRIFTHWFSKVNFRILLYTSVSQVISSCKVLGPKVYTYFSLPLTRAVHYDLSILNSGVRSRV
jgi:hypothetical protein